MAPTSSAIDCEIDVRGDGTFVPYRGTVAREELDPNDHETPCDLVRETLGDHIFNHFVEAKREEWFDYIRQVSPWEVERYLAAY